MAERKQCEFQLIRYVPDPVRNEFVNIGVLLRASAGEQSVLRFTRDWARVLCLDPDADTQMFEALEIEIGQRLRSQPADHPKPIMALLEGSLSNGVQITETKGHLAESFVSAVEDLMRLYVDSPRRERKQRRGGRAAIVAAMRTQFEAAGVWTLMRKHIAAANYTQPGDSLRIDCGYRNGVVKMFQAVSLEGGVDEAKLLAFAAPALCAGVKRVDQAKLELTAIIEPIGWPEGDTEPDEERAARYKYATRTLERRRIRVLATDRLADVAQTARADLKL
jgi:Protein of unknown function (DUF3037)